MYAVDFGGLAAMEACCCRIIGGVFSQADLLVRIAADLQTVEAILAAVRHRIKPRPSNAGPFVTPRQGVEESLASIWSECLAAAPIGARDNFFDFGGQSLIATRILARVHEQFGVKMNLTSLFERPTVEEMAAHVSGAMASRTNKPAEAIR